MELTGKSPLIRYISDDMTSDISGSFMKNRATIFSSVMNLINTIVGVGLLGIPSAVDDTGYILATFLFIIFGLLAFIGNYLQYESQSCIGSPCTYAKLAKITIPNIYYIVDISAGLGCFGACIAFITVIGDVMQDALIDFIDIDSNSYDILTDRIFWQIIYLIIFIIPLSYLKRLDSLKYTSILAILCFIVITITLMVYLVDDNLNPSSNDGNIKGNIVGFNGDWLKIFKASPKYIYAFTCHQNTFAIGNELQNPTLFRGSIILGITMIFCVLLYGFVGFSAYFTYGDNIEGNLLLSYPNTKYMGFIRIWLSLAIAFSYPMVFYVCRSSFGCLIFDVDDVDLLNNKKYYILTYILVILTFIVALISNSLEIILALNGATAATFISFILPGLFYYYLDINIIKNYFEYNVYEYPWSLYIKKKLALFMIIFGIIICPLTIVFQFV